MLTLKLVAIFFASLPVAVVGFFSLAAIKVFKTVGLLVLALGLAIQEFAQALLAGIKVAEFIGQLFVNSGLSFVGFYSPQIPASVQRNSEETTLPPLSHEQEFAINKEIRGLVEELKSKDEDDIEEIEDILNVIVGMCNTLVAHGASNAQETKKFVEEMVNKLPHIQIELTLD